MTRDGLVVENQADGTVENVSSREAEQDYSKMCIRDRFREFAAKTLTKEQRPSIRKVLAAAKQKVAQQPKRAKEKIKQRGLER